MREITLSPVKEEANQGSLRADSQRFTELKADVSCGRHPNPSASFLPNTSVYYHILDPRAKPPDPSPIDMSGFVDPPFELQDYKYDPIPSDPNHIRLIDFIDAQTIKIQQVSLDDGPIFRALSYVWGHNAWESRKQLRVQIQVGNRTDYRKLMVTNDCMLALKRLHEEDDETPVWIDAICIDQFSDVDHNHQVQRMSKIYSMACIVEIYLGPGNKMTERGFSYVEREYKLLRTGNTPLAFNSYTLHARPDEREGLDEILSRPWFRRRWVLQEVFCAQNAQVICGKNIISWEMLRVLGYHRHQDKLTLGESPTSTPVLLDADTEERIHLF